MKRSVFVIALFGLLLTAASSRAQIEVNPKVGINLSNLDTKLTDIDAEARVGWNAGVDFRLGRGFFFVNPGVHYYSFTARLIQDVDPNDDIKFKEETTIESIKVPLNLGLRLTGEGGLIALHAKGGVAGNVITGVKERPDFSFDRDDLKDVTFGANVGLGLDIFFLTVDVNYEIGLNEFFENSSGKNNMLTFSAGIKF